MASNSTQPLHEALRRLRNGLRNSDDVMLVREAVLRRIRRKLGSRRCDLWVFLRERCNYTDAQIKRHLQTDLEPETRGKHEPRPSLIDSYAELITGELLRTNGQHCMCYESYEGERRGAHMQAACEHKHTVRSYEAPIRHNEKSILTGQVWIDRAVDGRASLTIKGGTLVKQEGRYRAFGTSMLCTVFDTPCGNKLRLVRENGKDRLVETGRRELSDFIPGGDSEGQRDSIITSAAYVADEQFACGWECTHCGGMVGKDGRACRKQGCRWQLHTKIPKSQVIEYFTAAVHTCENRHFWPNGRVEQCSDCSQPKKDRIKGDWAYVAQVPDADSTTISYDETNNAGRAGEVVKESDHDQF